MFSKIVSSKNISIVDVVRTLLRTIDSAISFLTKENKLLSIGSLEAAKMLEQKNKILGELQEAEIKVHPYLQQSELHDVQVKKLLDKVKIRYNILCDLLDKNHVLLESNIKTAEMIMDMYSKTKVNQVVDQSGYDKEGKIEVRSRLEQVMPSISINSKI